MTLKPMSGRVILLPIAEKDAITESGIYIPDKGQERIGKATVVAVPNDLSEDLKKGNIVHVDKFVGSKIKNNGKEYQVVKVEDIICIEN